jgi:RNA polymerase sigma-70 factor (ECF subfamily)
VEEVEQEVLVALVEALKRFRGDSSFRTYLARVVRFKAKTHHRTRGRREKRVQRGAVDGWEETVEAPAGWGPEDLLVASETRRAFWAAWVRLPEADRTVLQLRVLEEWSEDETAQVMGLSPGGVRSRVFRAKKKLARLVVEEEG